MTFNHFFELLDLQPVHTGAAVAGLFLSAYCIALFNRRVFENESCFTARSLRMLAVLLFGLSCWWSLSYSELRHWQPWPADVVLLLAGDLYLVSTIIAAWARKRVLG